MTSNARTATSRPSSRPTRRGSSAPSSRPAPPSMLLGAVGKCHVKSADAQFKGAPVDDEACETSGGGKSALEKYTTATGPGSKIDTSTGGVCTQACLNSTNRAGLGASYLAYLETNNHKFYPCAAGTTTT